MGENRSAPLSNPPTPVSIHRDAIDQAGRGPRSGGSRGGAGSRPPSAGDDHSGGALMGNLRRAAAAANAVVDWGWRKNREDSWDFGRVSGRAQERTGNLELGRRFLDGICLSVCFLLLSFFFFVFPWEFLCWGGLVNSVGEVSWVCVLCLFVSAKERRGGERETLCLFVYAPWWLTLPCLSTTLYSDRTTVVFHLSTTRSRTGWILSTPTI